MERIDRNLLRHDEDSIYYYQGKSFTGIAYEYYSSGQIASEAFFVDGLNDGWARLWYENGQLESETLYKKGYANGPNRDWYPNGQLKQEEEIERAICLWSKEWDEQGNLVKEYELTPDHWQYEILQTNRRMEAYSEE